MATRPPSSINSWHAHVYFDADGRDAAWALRERISAELADHMQMGRFHEKPVGPHPLWSYQLAIPVPDLALVLSWLALKHGALDVLVHPNTSDELRDHRDSAPCFVMRDSAVNFAAAVACAVVGEVPGERRLADDRILLAGKRTVTV